MKDNEILICACNSVEHQIVFIKDEDEKLIYCQIHLNNYDSFLQRLITGIRYIFGYKCKCGHWDEFILSENHIESLEEAVEFLKKND